MTEYSKDLIVIIAGYKDDIEKNLFSMNEGLKFRFIFISFRRLFKNGYFPINLFENQTYAK